MTDLSLSLRPTAGSGVGDAVRDIARAVGPPLVAAAVLLAGWQLVCEAAIVEPRLLPSPVKVFATLGRSLDVLLVQALPTLYGALAGIGLAALLGLLLGGALAWSQTVMRAVYPTVVFFQLIPKVALAPLFLLWFGTGLAANIVFSVFIAFFPVLVATITGLQATPPAFDGLCRSLGMSRMRQFLAVKLPFALPYIFSGMRMGVTFAVIGVVLGEFITGQAGLGYIILFSANNFETALLLASIVVLCGVGALLFGLFLGLEAIVLCLYDSR
ncbi:MAG: ABC transporter permease [Alphaproteobacteria bacterium]|nr:ABC transporter permease [Alphaproteobacteria bacterium]MBV8411569.1 ABC transporter permease [Alphaproteobacteria bacterium]